MKRTFLDQKSKETLRKGVRGLRERLIAELTEEVKSEYQLDLPSEKAKLPAGRREKRKRLETSLLERARTAPKAAKAKVKAGEIDTLELRLAATEAAHTLLNRLVFLRILEHHEVLKPALVTRGWDSPAFAQEFAHYGAEFKDEPSRGYLALLEVVYAELALDLPALFGPVGVTALFPIPVPTLRSVLELLSDPALDAAWGDDTTLGWIYQFWNDPERERLDEKIAGGGKIEPHELGPKTQMFTERYMVEWLLHNTLGQTWLAMCRQHSWTPDFEQVRDPLDARRAAFRKQREAGEVPPDALMPIEGGLEEQWKYWVPQPLPEEAVSAAPATLRDLKLLDPACGSGHFLVIAFDLLAALYEEEARHRSEIWDPNQIAQWIVERNLHGIDIDARAIQLSAAALWLKAKLYAPQVALSRMNLVAPIFRLGALPKDDPSLVQLCNELARFLVPKEVTLKLVEALSGVDHLGTLLRVDEAVAQLLTVEEKEDEPLLNYTARKKRVQVLDRLTDFLDEHAAEADLGLRLEGEQLEAGMRFVGIAKKDTYDIVVGNPPYQGIGKLRDGAYVRKNYPEAKQDLLACFYVRALEVAKEGGQCAFITLSNWMFLSSYAAFRTRMLDAHLNVIADLGKSAFTTGGTLISTSCAAFRKVSHHGSGSVALRPHTPDEVVRDDGQPHRTQAALLLQRGRYEFDVAKLSGIASTPLVYWWDSALLQQYVNAPKLASSAPARKGLCTGDDMRFLRYLWECATSNVAIATCTEGWTGFPEANSWAPTIKGGKGRRWVEPLVDLVQYRRAALEIRIFDEVSAGVAVRNPGFYFVPGVAFTMVGSNFAARIHRYRSVFGNKGSSVFPTNIADCVCLMNSSRARVVLQSLNPGIGFEVGDVNRLPLWLVGDATTVMATIDAAFTQHESHREPSVEFKSPGPSPWRHAQAWAQLAVDRPEGAPLPPCEPQLDPPDPIAYVSFAVGVALGRFGANAEGILNEAPADALPAGILYLAGDEALPDSFKHPAAQRILEAWKEHAPAILQGKRQSLSEWLKKDFFRYHLGLYENRPIYFPLASSQKSFVAFISIHRWTDSTLQDLLALHLAPALRQLAGEIADLNKDRASSDKTKSAAAEKQFTRSKRLHDELLEFIAKVTECAERGAPPTDASCAARAQDAKLRMDLDDGVMINSAALWPLLEPLWPKPKAWWKELCQAKGRKDYDWSHLARRYFPVRVDDKCKQDPSLGVAHGCFWKYHPAKAYAWELRLQHEIKPTFTIDEPDSDTCRTRFLADHPDEAATIREKEQLRRDRAEKKKLQAEDDTVDAELESDPETDNDEE